MGWMIKGHCPDPCEGCTNLYQGDCRECLKKRQILDQVQGIRETEELRMTPKFLWLSDCNNGIEFTKMGNIDRVEGPGFKWGGWFKELSFRNNQFEMLGDRWGCWVLNLSILKATITTWLFSHSKQNICPPHSFLQSPNINFSVCFLLEAVPFRHLYAICNFSSSVPLDKRCS